MFSKHIFSYKKSESSQHPDASQIELSFSWENVARNSALLPSASATLTNCSKGILYTVSFLYK